MIEILMTALAIPLAKFLLKSYLGEPAGVVGGGLIDIASKRVVSYQQQREAARQFERLGEQVVSRLLPLFENSVDREHLNLEAVVAELGLTLQGKIHAEFFVSRDLDPVKLTAALREARSVDTGLSAAETALYDRALDEAVRYIVDVATRLPKFESRAVAASLQRLAHIANDLEAVLETTQRIERSVALMAEKLGTEEERRFRYEADYRLMVSRKLDYVELFGVDVRPEAQSQSLSVAYVSLNVQQQATGQKGEPVSLPVDRVLDLMNPGAGRLLIRGEAGSGKSTLFRWVALEAASLRHDLFEASLVSDEIHNRLNTSVGVRKRERGLRKVLGIEKPRTDRQNSWRMRIPFLLRLRECKAGRIPDPDHFPLFVARELGAPPPEWVRAVLTSGRAIVLLDGVDEVPHRHRDDLRRDIEGILTAYPHNYYLLSTRPAAVGSGWLGGLGFHEAAVDPMSDTDKRFFIERWHQAVTRELERQGSPDPGLLSLAGKLMEQLLDNPQMSRLASNPLLCAMICALHRERHTKLPESQTELCEAVCQMLLDRRDREVGVPLEEFPAAYRELSYSQKRVIVQDIGHYMVRNGLSTITRTQATHTIASTIRLFPGRSESGIRDILGGLVERSGILRESQPDGIDFVHNTIKEFLAGERFANDGDSALLSEMVMDPAWQPVVLFAASSNSKSFATELIHYILRPPHQKWKLWHGESRDNTERSRQIFVLRLRAMALHLEPELEEELREIERTLFPPHSFSDAEGLAMGGDSAVKYLRYSAGLNPYTAAACVRTLRLIGTGKARRYVREYLVDSRPTVVSELAQALDPLEIPTVLEAVLRGEPLEASVRGQISDLLHLSDHTELSALDVSQTRVNDLSLLSQLTGLRRLNLSGTPVTDLAPLVGLEKLEFLDVSQTKVRELSPIAELPALRVLNLSGTPVSDLTPLAGLEKLDSLDVSHTQVRELVCLEELHSLRVLNLAALSITEVPPLRLPGLRILDVSRTRLERIGSLRSFSALEALVLSNTVIRDFAPLLELANLRSLDLSRSRIDTAVVERLSGLEILYLAKVDLNNVTFLSGLTNLRVLDLTATNVHDISPLNSLVHLEQLYLAQTPATHATGVLNLPQLEVIRTILPRE